MYGYQNWSRFLIVTPLRLSRPPSGFAYTGKFSPWLAPEACWKWVSASKHFRLLQMFTVFLIFVWLRESFFCYSDTRCFVTWIFDCLVVNNGWYDGMHCMWTFWFSKSSYRLTRKDVVPGAFLIFILVLFTRLSSIEWILFCSWHSHLWWSSRSCPERYSIYRTRWSEPCHRLMATAIVPLHEWLFVVANFAFHWPSDFYQLL